MAAVIIGEGYAGHVQAGAYTIRVDAGNFNAGSSTASFNAGTGRIIFAGTEEQELRNVYNDGFSAIEVAAGASVYFTKIFTASLLKIGAGAKVTFASGETFNLASIDWQGTQGAPIVVKPSSVGTPWKLRLTADNQAIAWVRAAGSDASPGVTIDGTDDCIDLGRNTNWTFASFAPSIPAASQVSPAFVEGWVNGGVPAVTVTAGTLAGTSGTPSEIVGGEKIESTGGDIDLVNEYRLLPEFACMIRVFVFS